MVSQPALACISVIAGDGVLSEESGGEGEEVEDLAPDLSNLRRTAGRGEKRPREQSEDLVGALFALGDKILKGNEAMGHNFIKFH